MVRRGKRRSSSRGARRGRRTRKEKVCEKNDKDRISKLPDELINLILSYVDSKVAVQTMVLSKRWVHVWTTLFNLNFESLRKSGVSENLAIFFFKNQNQQCDISEVTLDCSGRSERFLRMCLDYVLSHNVEHLFIKGGNFADSLGLNSTRLRTLKLENCRNICLEDYWSLPSLTCFYLKNVAFGKEISRFDNLKELTLVERQKLSTVIIINCPNLRSLSLNLLYPHKFIVSAPTLSCLNLCSRHVPAGFSARDGFPCIKQVKINIGYCYGDYDYGRNKKNTIKLTMKIFVGLLNAVRETPLLEISSYTIEVLLRTGHFSEYEPSPLGNLKCLSVVQGQFTIPVRYTGSIVQGEYDRVIKYLMSNSPCAELVEA